MKITDEEIKRVAAEARTAYFDPQEAAGILYEAGFIDGAEWAAESADKWVTVSERLPEQGWQVRAIITFGNGQMKEIHTHWVERTKCFDHLLCDNITHWQYIDFPAPPQTETGL